MCVVEVHDENVRCAGGSKRGARCAGGSKRGVRCAGGSKRGVRCAGGSKRGVRCDESIYDHVSVRRLPVVSTHSVPICP